LHAMQFRAVPTVQVKAGDQPNGLIEVTVTVR
jgi:hypothetical protein